MRILLVLFCGVVLLSCKKEEQVLNKFSDPVHIQIADYQDRRYSDSLFQFFKNENAEYRSDAVLAFASIQDSIALEPLRDVLLTDADVSVRKAAAFSLGQLPGRHVAAVLEQALKQENDTTVLIEILEALGKQAGDLEYWKTAPDISEGLSWSLYRASLRGVTDSTVLQKAIGLLKSENSVNVRLGAAQFFARGAKNYDKFQRYIIEYFLTEPNPEVRMALVLSLRKIKTDSALQAIRYFSDADADYRVRVNAIRALQSFPFDKTKEALIAVLNDENINVGIAASEVIKATITEITGKEIISLARSSKNGRIKANLFEAAWRTNNTELPEEIIRAYEKTTNPYDKAALLTALQPSVESFDFIQKQLFKTDTHVIRSAAASALVAINYHKKFDPSLKKQFAEIYQKAIERGDPAVVGTIAGALGDSALTYNTIIKDHTFLLRAKEQLSLPKDNESLQSVETAIAYFEGKKSQPIKNTFNHPIDWKLVKTISKDQRVRIRTTKGDIVIQLLVEEAPGSVANFVHLVNQRYFDKKFFHRVVPNFVAQAGCNRGDGWGSENYSIRSEFSSRRYKTGSIGMASAGKDTEGTQWFITHSPTSHLDGRYTIFAELVDGMNVVQQLEVGDGIQTVELLLGEK